MFAFFAQANALVPVPQPCAILAAHLASSGPAIQQNLESRMDTRRIQRALHLCQPGQAVVLSVGGSGAGRKDAFLSAPLIIPRGVTLFVGAGVTLYASRNPRDYDLAPESCGATVSGKAAQCKPFLFSYQAAYSGVMGPGDIDGQGGAAPGEGQPSWWQRLRIAKAQGRVIAVPSLVSDYESQGFKVAGVTLRNAPGIHLAVYKTTDLHISGLAIQSPPGSAAETGLLLSNVHGAHIDGASIQTPSTAIALEASILGSTYYVHLNHILIHGGHGILIGNSKYGDVNHVWIEDSAIQSVEHPVTLRIQSADHKQPRAIVLKNVSFGGARSPVQTIGADGKPLPLGAASNDIQVTGAAAPLSSAVFAKLRFAAVSAPAKAPGIKRTLIVAADGSGDFRSVQAAVDALPDSGGTVLIKPGVYGEVVTIRKPHVTLRGESSDPRAATIVYNNVAGKSGGTFNTATVFVEADNVAISHLTITNDVGYGKGQGVALAVTGDRDSFRWVDIHGHQDTLFAASKYCYGDYGPCIPARQYFSHCYIDGNVDFIFGDSEAVFSHCELYGNPRGNVMYTAQSKHVAIQKSGYVFDHCTLTAAARTQGKVSLGRPWRPYATVVYLNTRMEADIIPEGWTGWPRFGKPSLPTAYYAEYNSTGPGASPKTREPYSHQLTAAEARGWRPVEFLAGKDGWDPLAVRSGKSPAE